MLKKLLKRVCVITLIVGCILTVPYDVYADGTPVIVDSWRNMITSEDSEVRRMYDIYDENVTPSMWQRFMYNMTKPFTDMINDITGTNELSYGAGGHIVRDRITNIFK